MGKGEGIKTFPFPHYPCWQAPQMKTDCESGEAGTSAPDFLSRRAGVLCVALLALMGAQMLFVVRQKSITVDEWVLIPAGFYHLTEGDYRPVHEHPPVAKVLGPCRSSRWALRRRPSKMARTTTSISSASSTSSGG